MFIKEYSAKKQRETVAQLVKNLPAMPERQFDSWVRSSPGERDRLPDRLPTPVFLGFPGGSHGEESTCHAGGLGSISGLGRSLGRRHGNPLHSSCLENPHGQRSLVGCGPWNPKELDTPE